MKHLIQDILDPTIRILAATLFLAIAAMLRLQSPLGASQPWPTWDRMVLGAKLGLAIGLAASALVVIFEILRAAYRRARRGT